MYDISIIVGNSMVSSAIWKKHARVHEFFKDYQNCTSRRTSTCNFKSLKNSRVYVFSNFNEKHAYYYLFSSVHEKTMQSLLNVFF
jgi:hypothetical protein